MGCPSSPDAHTETWTKAFGFPGVSKITYQSQKGEYSELLPSRRPSEACCSSLIGEGPEAHWTSQMAARHSRCISSSV